MQRSSIRRTETFLKENPMSTQSGRIIVWQGPAKEVVDCVNGWQDQSPDCLVVGQKLVHTQEGHIVLSIVYTQIVK